MNDFTRSRTATGAAHSNWSMFGARGPCLQVAGGTGGGAAAGAAPNGTPAPEQKPQPASTSAADPAFSPEQQAVVDKLVGKARQEGRDAASKKTPAPAPSHDGGASTVVEEVTLKSIQAELAETKLRARFDKRAAKLGIDDDASEDLFELYRAQKPSDDSEWFEKKMKTFGIKQPAATTATITTTAQAGQQTPPISDKGSPAPGNASDWEREFAENPIGMSPAARQRMDAKHGVEKARKMRLEAANAQAERIKVTKPQG